MSWLHFSFLSFLPLDKKIKSVSKIRILVWMRKNDIGWKIGQLRSVIAKSNLREKRLKNGPFETKMLLSPGLMRTTACQSIWSDHYRRDVSVHFMRVLTDLNLMKWQNWGRVRPWWWSIGQCPRRLLQLSEFESCWLKQFFLLKKDENKQKAAGIGQSQNEEELVPGFPDFSASKVTFCNRRKKEIISLRRTLNLQNTFDSVARSWWSFWR